MSDLIGPMDEEDVAEKHSKENKRKKRKNKHPTSEEGDDILMDADFLPIPHERHNTKPSTDIRDQLDEVYQLEYEDMIGDLPTRFKYQQVTATSFGLDPVEILLADDRDLNRVVSLKKLAPYRSNTKQRKDLERFANKKHLGHLKKKLADDVAKAASLKPSKSKEKHKKR